MLKISLALLLIAVNLIAINCIQFDPEYYEWHSYKSHQGKNYDAIEDPHRFEIYKQNKLLINAHNKLADEGLYNFRLGFTKFADWTNEEYRKYNGFGGQRRAASDVNGVRRLHRPNRTVGALPTTVDWRTKGLVTPVKDQGQCGSCWAFSAVAGLEGQHAKATGKLVSLSEQNLVDCSQKEGNQGCNGGLMDQAFQYIKDVGGIDTETSYPYEAKDDTCRFKKTNVGATLKSWKDIKSGDEAALQDASANIGPISVAIDASSIWFQLYFGGVYDHTDCKNDVNSLDHGVTVVGYGTESGADYWLIKNSWGSSWWGESGYMKLARNKNNLCGVATAASYPVV